MNWRYMIVIIGIISLMFGSAIGDDVIGGIFLLVAILMSLMVNFVPDKRKVVDKVKEAPAIQVTTQPVVQNQPIQAQVPVVDEFAAQKAEIDAQMEKLRLAQEQLNQPVQQPVQQPVPVQPQPKPPKQKIPCKICGDEFNTEGQYNKHIFFKHPKEIKGIELG